MSDWFDTTLGDVVEVRVSNVDKKTLPGERSVRLCNYMDVYSTNAVTPERVLMPASATKPEYLRFRLLAGDVVITKDSESPDDIAVPTYIAPGIGEDVVCGYHLAMLRPKPSVDGHFLSYLLRLPEVNLHFANVATGSTRYGLGLQSIHDTPLRIPKNLSEQRGIAEVLSALDEQIEQTEALITKLDLTRSGLYASLRDTHPPTIQIGEHFNLTSGMTPLRSTTHFYGSEGVPWVKTLDLNEGWLSEIDEKVTARALAACSLRILPAGTVLLAMYGGWIQIGRTALLATDACTNQAITALCPKCPANWNPYFVMKALQAWRHKWRDFAVSTRKDPNITKSDISQFMLPMPGIVEQTHWAENLETADELVNTHKAEAAKLRLQKQGLIRNLLTGKIRVV